MDSKQNAIHESQPEKSLELQQSSYWSKQGRHACTATDYLKQLAAFADWSKQQYSCIRRSIVKNDKAIHRTTR
eukprot:scaffold1119_cov120-Cylindrotheca_fusiformis.AAC.6